MDWRPGSYTHLDVYKRQGFGRGLGVLDASSTRLKNMYMIDIEQISQDDAEEILRLFENIKGREEMCIRDRRLRAKYTHRTNFVYALCISPCRELCCR